MEASEPVVADVPEQSRFEIRLGGELVGFASYDLRPGVVAFLHTEIDPSFEGRGLASRLIRAALDDVRKRGLSVLPFCPYVLSWIERHPDHVDLVPAGERGRFGLPAENRA